MTEPDAVGRFARLVDDAPWNAMPAPAQEAAKVFFLDALAVGAAGSVVASSDAVLGVAKGWGEGRQCTVLGRRERLPPASAAYVNAFQVHCQEFDCLHEEATVHALAVVTGAVLAQAERDGNALEDVLAAVVVGVEVAVTLGLAATGGLRFFRPATAGLMGASAALARLAGMNEPRFRDTFGLAYSQLAGTMQAHVEGSVALPLQVAAAARAAVNAVELVRAGLEGPHDVLQGPFGYFELFEPGGDLARVMTSPGEPWRVTELSHKPFPTGRAAHGTLDGLGRLVARHGFRREEVASVTAHVPPLVRRLVDRPYRADMSLNTARLCLPYLVPVFLGTGTIDTGSFSESLLRDPGIAEFSRKVRFEDDGNPDPNALSPQRVTVRLDDGREWTQEVRHTLGSPDNPLDEDQRRDKVRHCFVAAGLGEEAALRLLREIGAENSPALGSLVACLTPPA